MKTLVITFNHPQPGYEFPVAKIHDVEKAVVKDDILVITLGHCKIKKGCDVYFPLIEVNSYDLLDSENEKYLKR